MNNPISAWIEKAAKIQDPLVTVALQAKGESNQIAWLLLSCALQQEIKIADLSCFLQELQETTMDITSLPALKEKTILQIINSKQSWRHWKLANMAPGIIWSVGRFARERNNALDRWAKEHSPSDIWRECGEIFYMGKNNGIRPKCLNFLHKLYLQSPIGWGIKAPPEKNNIKPPPLPVTAGARRWMFRTGIYNSEESQKEKLQTANRLYKDLYPKNPSLACHALQFFTEPLNENDYFCSNKIFKCSLCPVSEYCSLQH